MALDPTAEPSERPPLAVLIAGFERARKHTFWTLAVLAIGTSVCWNYSHQLFALLAAPLSRELAAQGQDPRLAFTGLTDPFILYFSVSLFGGLVLALPLILLQVFMVMAPYLRARRTLAAAAFVIAACALFTGGISFCYWVLLPFAIHYLLQVASGFEHAVTVRDYLRFSIRLMLAMGGAAQLPLITFTAARLGLVSARTLLRWLPYATVGAFILGAWLTPPDVLSQVLVAVPLLGLYLLGVVVAALAARGSRRS